LALASAGLYSDYMNFIPDK